MAEEGQEIPKNTNPENPPKSHTSQTYAGLEKLSQIAEDEQLFKGALNIEDLKDEMRSRLNEIKVKKNALFRECGISDEMRQKIEKREGKNLESLRWTTAIRRLLVEQLAGELPPTEEGYARLFRGEEPPLEEIPEEHLVDGKWFHILIEYASAFPGANDPSRSDSMNCRYLYIDIPEKDLPKYYVNYKPAFFGSSKKGEYLLPPEIKARAKEFARFLTAETIGDPWAASNKPQPVVTGAH